MAIPTTLLARLASSAPPPDDERRSAFPARCGRLVIGLSAAAWRNRIMPSRGLHRGLASRPCPGPLPQLAAVRTFIREHPQELTEEGLHDLARQRIVIDDRSVREHDPDSSRIAGMTDSFLLKTYYRLFSPRMGSAFDRIYLAVILDACSHKIVGYALSRWLGTPLVHPAN